MTGTSTDSPFERWARERRLAKGAFAMVAAGLVWAALCAVLAAAGHAPTVALVPIPRGRYYLAQAAFVVPALLALWLLSTAVASRVARALGGRGDLRATATPMAIALSLPLVVLFLLPDLVAYAVAGFGALGPLVRVTAPLSFLSTLALAARAVKAAHALPIGRALVAAAAGVLAQAAIGGLLLR